MNDTHVLFYHQEGRMPERRIPTSYGIEVCATKEGQVCIKQESPFDEEESILIDPRLVPTVVKWLQECADETLAHRGAANEGSSTADARE